MPARALSAATRGSVPIQTLFHLGLWAGPLCAPWLSTTAVDPMASAFRRQTAGPSPLEIEIGFGRGDFLLDRAARRPERWFVGFEVRTKAVRLALRRLENRRLENLWLSDDDARVGLQLAIPDQRVDALHVLFPDPWWKAQHKVKRPLLPSICRPAGGQNSSGRLPAPEDRCRTVRGISAPSAVPSSGFP